MNGNGNDPDPIDAVRALRARGIDNAEELIQHGTPEQILAACHRWDTRRGVGPGLLASWIRNHEFDDPTPTPAKTKSEHLRVTFDEYANRFPVGAVAESHSRMIHRRWLEDVEYALNADIDLCDGDMVVIDVIYPLISVECDRCGFEAAYPVSALHVLPDTNPSPF